MSAMNELFNKIPIVPLAIVALLYQGWNYYQWKTGPTMPYQLQLKQLASAKESKESDKKSLAEAESFYKNLDIMKGDIVQLSSQLEQAKGMLTSEIDVAQFIKILTLEAKKIGIIIRKITPGSEVKKELFAEVPFRLEVVGAYVQILVFFDKIARFQQVLKVDSFDLKPTGGMTTKYIELEGKIDILAYKYLTASEESSKNLPNTGDQ